MYSVPQNRWDSLPFSWAHAASPLFWHALVFISLADLERNPGKILIKQSKIPARPVPANAPMQSLHLTLWDVLLVVAVIKMLPNSDHSPMKNNYKCLIQDNSLSVVKCYSCAHN